MEEQFLTSLGEMLHGLKKSWGQLVQKREDQDVESPSQLAGIKLNIFLLIIMSGTLLNNLCGSTNLINSITSQYLWEVGYRSPHFADKETDTQLRG